QGRAPAGAPRRCRLYQRRTPRPQPRRTRPHLRGPTRPSQGWQTQVEGAYTLEQCAVDWDQQHVRCPQGQWSAAWWDHGAPTSSHLIYVEFALEDCQACPARAVCTRAQAYGNGVLLAHMRFGRYTLYCHLAEMAVQAGQSVKRGDIIGRKATGGE